MSNINEPSHTSTPIKMPSPTSAPSSTPVPSSPSIPTLTTHLDTLLTQYLTLLSTHQTLSTSSTSAFRAGLFSLTEANFRSPNRTRYGEDLYSDKMQASLILEHSEPKDSNPTTPTMRYKRLATGIPAKKQRRTNSETNEEPGLSKMCGSEEQMEKASAESKLTASSTSRPSSKSTQLPTPPVSRASTPAATVPASTATTPAPAPPKPSSEPECSTPSTPTQSSNPDPEPSGGLPRDPIRQFGILVPAALRAAQSSFSRAAEGWIESIETDRQMRELEIEIRRVRKRLRKAEAEGTKGSRRDSERAGTEGGLEGES